jgi:hypothetical protein
MVGLSCRCGPATESALSFLAPRTYVRGGRESQAATSGKAATTPAGSTPRCRATTAATASTSRRYRAREGGLWLDRSDTPDEAMAAADRLVFAHLDDEVLHLAASPFLARGLGAGPAQAALADPSGQGGGADPGPGATRLRGRRRQREVVRGSGPPRGAHEPCGDERAPPCARRSERTEAEGSLIPGTRGRVDSSPDNDGTGQYCQMVRVRQARQKGVREEPATERSSSAPSGSNPVDQGRAAARTRLGAGNSWVGSCRRPGGHGEGLRRSRGDAAGP